MSTSRRIRRAISTVSSVDLYHRWRTQAGSGAAAGTPSAGEKLFVDYAGDTVPIVDRHTGETQDASIFVAVLGGKATIPMRKPPYGRTYPPLARGSHPGSGVPGGLPLKVNASQTTPKMRSVAPVAMNRISMRSYADWATHYGVAVIPARVRHPRSRRHPRQAPAQDRPHRRTDRR